ncbi:MAG: hydantoinase B/oxoprolinase family protein [Acidimicrobiales bacterium]
MSRQGIAAVDHEIVRNRLLAITEEMRVTLQSVSGSPTVTEASDFFTGIYCNGGEFATMGMQVTHEAPVVGALVRYIESHRRVEEGDMYVANDPYIGALHQNDVQMVVPIFCHGDRVAWAGVMAHETDVGGMEFASWCPKATEIYQEGQRIPAVKLVERDRVRDDVLEMIVAASRLPEALELDIRAFIATLHVARDRLLDLIGAYGLLTVERVMAWMIDTAEEAMEERLEALPDATVHVRDFLEHDGHEDTLYAVDLVATKLRRRLRLDFGGSSPQARGFINATRAGLHGGVTGALIPTLGFGLRWNAGLLRPVDVVAPDGLICTAVHPAPVGAATVETVWTVTNTVQRALNLLLGCSDGLAQRCQAVSSGTMATFNLGGVNQFGERFGLHLLDPLGGGSGSLAWRDGIDAGGPIAVPVPAIADVESNEQVSPLFYLYRRLAPETGGAGRFRGGNSAEIAVTLRGTERGDAIIMTHGAEVPNAVGMFGGWPGSTVSQCFSTEEERVRHLPPRRLGPKPGNVTMRPGDVFSVTWQGGGGWGDPIDREPEAVADDVRRELLLPATAASVYGVVLTEEGVDLAGTDRRREEIRRTRLAAASAPAGTVAASPEVPELREAPVVRHLGPCLSIVRHRTGTAVRTAAGATLSDGPAGWRRGAAVVPVAPAEHGITLHPDLAMTAYCCPASGTQLAVDVHRRGEMPDDDILVEVGRP